MKQRFRCRLEKLEHGDLCLIVFTGQREKKTRNPICVCLNFGSFYYDHLIYTKKRVIGIFRTDWLRVTICDSEILISKGNKRFDHYIRKKTIYELLGTLNWIQRSKVKRAKEYLENAY